MDFSNRNSQAPVQRPVTSGNSATPSVKKSNDGKFIISSKWLRAGAVALLFCLVAIIAAVLLLIYFGDKSEFNNVEKNKLQAVFLNNGQVYFGNLQSINSDYFDLSNIYYLRSNSTSTSTTATTDNSNISLVKLGCELHGPEDNMIISTSQVSFWENLKTDGQVAKAIASYQKSNPKQTCSTSSSSSQSTPNATTPSNTSGSTGTGSTSSTGSNSSTKTP